MQHFGKHPLSESSQSSLEQCRPPQNPCCFSDLHPWPDTQAYALQEAQYLASTFWWCSQCLLSTDSQETTLPRESWLLMQHTTPSWQGTLENWFNVSAFRLSVMDVYPAWVESRLVWFYKMHFTFEYEQTLNMSCVSSTSTSTSASRCSMATFLRASSVQNINFGSHLRMWNSSTWLLRICWITTLQNCSKRIPR